MLINIVFLIVCAIFVFTLATLFFRIFLSIFFEFSIKAFTEWLIIETLTLMISFACFMYSIDLIIQICKEVYKYADRI